MTSVQSGASTDAAATDIITDATPPGADNASIPHKQPRPALATAKRKFSRLLDNLTSTTSRESHETSAKRLRLEAKSKLAQGDTNHALSSANTELQSDLLKSKLRSKTRPPSEPTTLDIAVTSEPNYAPWSHEQFLNRLKTFADPTKWTEKPDAINEAEWAKRGWMCVTTNTVVCRGGCEGRVVISLSTHLDRDADEDDEVDDINDFDVNPGHKLVDKYKEFMITGHVENCPWRGSGCRDDIYRMPIAQSSVWRPQLEGRYRSFEQMDSELPSLERMAYPFDLTNITSLLPSELFSASSLGGINHAALAFALLGWHGSMTESGYALAKCSACFRRVGLWLFTASAEEDEDDDTSTTKLDLVSSHRPHCPWINPESQHMPGSFAGLAAWEVLVRVIKNNATSPSARDRARLPQHPISSSDDLGAQTGDEDGNAPVQGSPSSSLKSREEMEKEDRARFARLKELTKSMGLGFKSKKMQGAGMKSSGT